MASSSAEQAPVKLLSIDGGGVRGLSALVVLEQLMDLTNYKREQLGLPHQELWEMFDMIGGTSTGGLIAIMLGRLRMSIKDCKAAYINLSERAFTKKNFLGRVTGKFTVGPRFETRPLEDAIKTIIGDEWATMLLKEVDIGCRAFVVAHDQQNNKEAILRSYRNFYRPEEGPEEMHLWQACRATSAALTFFEPIEVDGTRYSDGGLLYNNPVQLVYREASEVFPGREQLIVSLGTGLENIREFEPSLTTVAIDLAGLATETERTASDFYNRHRGTGRYFRFNVPQLGQIGLEESTQLHDITRLTKNYLNGTEVVDKVDLCAHKLAEGPRTPSPIPSPIHPVVGGVYTLLVTDAEILTVLDLQGDVKLRPPLENTDSQKQQWRVEASSCGKFGFRNMFNQGLLGVNGAGFVGASTFGLGGWERFSLPHFEDGRRFIVDQWWRLQNLPLVRQDRSDFLQVQRLPYLGSFLGSPVTIKIVEL